MESKKKYQTGNVRIKQHGGALALPLLLWKKQYYVLYVFIVCVCVCVKP